MSYRLDFIKNLRAAYGHINLGDVQVQRINEFIQDLPDKALIEIENNIIDEYQKAPPPARIKEIVQIWKSRNNFHKIVDAPRSIECGFCFETGYTLVKVSDEGPPYYMFCDCKFGKAEQELNLNFMMPVWQNNFRGHGMERVKFNRDSFIPKDQSLEEIMRNRDILKIANSFKAYILKSEAKWKELILIK